MGLGLPPIDTATTAKGYIPAGWVLDPQTGELVAYDPNNYVGGEKARIKPGQTIHYGGGYFTFDPQAGGLTTASESEIKRYNADAGTGGAGQRMASDDPRYWQLQYDQLAAQYMNMGLDSESARRQALTTLIANRNNLAGNIADTSAGVAKTAADYAANPRDAYAEAYYSNQVGGGTPFGDLHNSAFGEYGKTLAEKAARIFQPVAQDLNSARGYRDSIPPVDFFGPDTRSQLGLPPTPAQAISGGTGGGLPASTATAPDILTQMTDRLKAMSPQDQQAFQQYVTAGQAPKPYAKGGQIDFGNATRFGNDQPSSSEGGTNMNIHEPAQVVGRSGRVYATIAEGGFPEQLIIKPTPSGKKKAMEMEKAGKTMDGMMMGAKPMATGGSVAATPDDLLAEFTKFMQRIGGSGGGTNDPFGGTRQLAGAPANEMLANPFAKAITEATYSAKGIDPAQMWADIAKFTPNSAKYQNIPQVSWA